MARLGTVGDMLKDQIEDNVKNMNNPDCRLCNECCSMGTMLLPEEYKRLKKFLKTNDKGKKIYRESMPKIKKYMDQGTIYFMCPFSTKNRRCAIYEIRPKACREFHCDPQLNKFDKDKMPNKHHTIFELFKNGFKKD